MGRRDGQVQAGRDSGLRCSGLETLRRPERSFSASYACSRAEERQLRLAVAAEDFEVDLDAADASRLCERRGLRLHALRGEDAAAAGTRGIEADALEVARQLLDRVDL